MHRTEGDGLVTGVGKYTGTINLFDDEDPPTRDATQLRHEEVNAYQEEICNVIEGESISLNAATETPVQMCQLEEAINNKLKSDRIENQSTVSGSAVSDALESNAQAISDVAVVLVNHQHGVGGISQVDLTADVSGILPRANFDHEHTHDDISESKVNLSTHVTGQIDLASQVTGILPFDTEVTTRALLEISFNGFSTAFEANFFMLSKTLTISPYSPVILVKCIVLAGILRTSNDTIFTASAGALGTYAPSQTVGVPIVIIDNGVAEPGTALFLATGGIEIKRHPFSTAFTGSGNKGFYDFSVEYIR